MAIGSTLLLCAGSGHRVWSEESAAPADHQFAGPISLAWLNRPLSPARLHAVGQVLTLSENGKTLYVAGHAPGDSGSTVYGLAAYRSADGGTIWTADDPTPPRFSHSAYDMALSPDGGQVCMTGTSAPPRVNNVTNVDYGTACFDASTGRRNWFSAWDGPQRKFDEAYDLAISSDGTVVVVTGRSWDDAATVAYDAYTGRELWTDVYDGEMSSHDAAYAVDISPTNERVFVAGSTNHRKGQFVRPSVLAIAYDLRSGDRLWEVRRSTAPESADSASLLAIHPDGRTVFVAGASTGPNPYGSYLGSYEFQAIAFDARSGGELWASFERRSRDDIPRAMIISANGKHLFLTGEGRGARDIRDTVTKALDSERGATLWLVRRDSGFRMENYSFDLVGSRSGHLLVASGVTRLPSRAGWPNTAWSTVGFDGRTGEEIWSALYETAGLEEDSPRALVLRNDGRRLFLTGTSQRHTPYVTTDTVTLAYDLPGDRSRPVRESDD